jgi:hypothetical protein
MKKPEIKELKRRLRKAIKERNKIFHAYAMKVKVVAMLHEIIKQAEDAQ